MHALMLTRHYKILISFNPDLRIMMMSINIYISSHLILSIFDEFGKLPRPSYIAPLSNIYKVSVWPYVGRFKPYLKATCNFEKHL
jgi:hypothetical protein